MKVSCSIEQNYFGLVRQELSTSVVAGFNYNPPPKSGQIRPTDYTPHHILTFIPQNKRTKKKLIGVHKLLFIRSLFFQTASNGRLAATEQIPASLLNTHIMYTTTRKGVVFKTLKSNFASFYFIGGRLHFFFLTRKSQLSFTPEEKNETFISH